MDYYKIFSEVSNILSNKQDCIVETNVFQKNSSNVLLPKQASASYRSFYEQMTEVNIDWRPSKYKKSPNVCGKINILPPDKVFSDWEGVVWFKDSPETFYLKHFKVLDLFVNEACVGFYDIENKNEELYYLYFEEEPIPLGINLDGYCQLLSLSFGFFYWQTAIVELTTKEKSQESKDFKRYMPKLFSDFSYDRFVDLYQKVKIKW